MNTASQGCDSQRVTNCQISKAFIPRAKAASQVFPAAFSVSYLCLCKTSKSLLCVPAPHFP